MSLFSVNQSEARTKQTDRQQLVSVPNIFNHLPVSSDSDANVRALLMLSASHDVDMDSEDSESDQEDDPDILRLQVKKLLIKHDEKTEKKTRLEQDLQNDKDTLITLARMKKKGLGNSETDQTIEIAKERMLTCKAKITGYKKDLKNIDKLLHRVVITQLRNYSKTADHTELTLDMAKRYLCTVLHTNCLYEKYSDSIDEFVAKERAKKMDKMDADTHKENKKKIKELMNSHFKASSVDQIKLSQSMNQLRAYLPHIPASIWQTNVYDDFVSDLIDEHKAKVNAKTSKISQTEVDKAMKKQIRDLIGIFAKKSDLENITEELCRAYLIAEVKDDCGHIDKYNELINEVMDAEIKKKISKQLLALKIVVKKTTEKRLRAEIFKYLETYDIFNPTAIMLPDTITDLEHEEHGEHIQKVVTQEIHAKARRMLRDCVTTYVKSVEDTDLNRFDLNLLKAYVTKSFHGTIAAHEIVNTEDGYIRNVVGNENVKKIKSQIISLLRAYMKTTDHSLITEQTCVYRILDLFRDHGDSGKSIVDRHHRFIHDTIARVHSNTLDIEIHLSDDEDEVDKVILAAKFDEERV